MAFIRGNLPKKAYIARARWTAELLSNAAYITTSIGHLGYPAPAAVEDVLWNIYAGSGTFMPVIMTPGSLSGNYLALSIFYSGTSASLAATASVVLVAQWLIGSK